MSACLELTDLVKKFGGLVATSGVSFKVEQGESIGLIGPNGAGKTTIFSQIMGELRQTSGKILLYGRDIRRLSTPARIKRGIGRTYQVPRPFREMNVLENIRVGLMPDNIWKMVFEGPDRDREEELALSVGLSPGDLLRTPAELSMGDLRKLEMARTMATEPSIMLLDEVFAGLTKGEISQIGDLIGELRDDGMTFLIVSHDLPALEPLVDRCIALDQGRKIAEGPFDEVMRDEAVRASYLGG
ncbi:MAG: ABC transporter ATP-binding protein [Roseovarius sp.]|nr:ABC transporter ATP-binding protein [Roseovarius sp.]MCY4207662.1 ABC transporter ATP-binding protein [Roseovarius sp.]MCY4292460.1 ABC transporter ATP-binding protein [Roseovarius sp.]MCY4314505.1 ABC transporter ATP-binding protein [Roseovarius sp.]